MGQSVLTGMKNSGKFSNDGDDFIAGATEKLLRGNEEKHKNFGAYHDNIVKFIKDHPLGTVGGGLAAGYLASKLIDKDDD